MNPFLLRSLSNKLRVKKRSKISASIWMSRKGEFEYEDNDSQFKTSYDN